MKRNVGTYDAFIRIMIGLIGLSYSTACMVRSPYRTTPMIVAILSAMKIAEGAFRFCPLFAVLNINTANKKGKRPYRISSYPRRVR